MSTTDIDEVYRRFAKKNTKPAFPTKNANSNAGDESASATSSPPARSPCTGNAGLSYPSSFGVLRFSQGDFFRVSEITNRNGMHYSCNPLMLEKSKTTEFAQILMEAVESRITAAVAKRQSSQPFLQETMSGKVVPLDVETSTNRLMGPYIASHPLPTRRPTLLMRGESAQPQLQPVSSFAASDSPQTFPLQTDQITDSIEPEIDDQNQTATQRMGTVKTHSSERILDFPR